MGSIEFGGTMGHWETDRTPALAHFVGAPDKMQNMKYVGFWNHDADVLAEWTALATEQLRPNEAAHASKHPLEAVARHAAEAEGDALQASMPTFKALQTK